MKSPQKYAYLVPGKSYFLAYKMINENEWMLVVRIGINWICQSVWWLRFFLGGGGIIILSHSKHARLLLIEICAEVEGGWAACL